MANENATTDQVHQFKELEKYGMFTPAPGVEGRRSRLVWSSFRGNPRITVFTGVPDDTNKGVITAPMNPETFKILMTLLSDVIRSAPGTKFYIQNFTRPKMEEGQKQPSEMIHLSDTWVGKDEEGVVWISVRAENRPTIVFKFQISDFHKIFKGNREPFTATEASVLQARAVMDGLNQVFSLHAGELRPPYDPEAAKAKRESYGKVSNKTYPKTTQPSKGAFSDLDDISY